PHPVDRGAAAPVVETSARDGFIRAVERLAPALRAASEEIERGRSLTEPIVAGLIEGGLYRMLLPRSLGGAELDPLGYFDVVEQLARVESAAAWSVLISTSTLMSTVRALPDDELIPVLAAPRGAVMPGSAPPRGRARPVPGGYRLSGTWTQGSNVLLAGWLHLGCHVYDGDAPRTGPDGRPLYRQCLISTSDVEVHDTWHTTGMRGTGSHDYTARDVFVPAARVHAAAERSPIR